SDVASTPLRSRSQNFSGVFAPPGSLHDMPMIATGSRAPASSSATRRRRSRIALSARFMSSTRPAPIASELMSCVLLEAGLVQLAAQLRLELQVRQCIHVNVHV